MKIILQKNMLFDCLFDMKHCEFITIEGMLKAQT